MLIRLVAHYINNPGHIDKLIDIKGLPEEWIFREVYDENKQKGKALVSPWEPDVTANIPKDLRKEEIEYIVRRPPIEKGAPWVIFREKCWGLKLNFATEPGRVLWEQIERYLEMSVPRDQRVPEPVLAAADHKMGFNPHRARRNSRGSLELTPCVVPVIDLSPADSATLVATPVSEPPDAPIQRPTPTPEPASNFACGKCDRVFNSKHGLLIHQSRPKNHVREKAGVA